MLRCCLCSCHGRRLTKIDGAWRQLPVGAEVDDPIAAATACARCLPFHAPALLDRRLANDRSFTDKTPWVDPPPSGEDGG